jgi:PKD repeat protein
MPDDTNPSPPLDPTSLSLRSSSAGQAVDGITQLPPEAAPVPVVSAPAPKLSLMPKKKGMNLPLIIFGILAVLYVVPAFAFMGMFPTPDGSLGNIRQTITLVYVAGMGLWSVLLLLGFLRIAAIQNHPRMRFFGSIRLVAMGLPMLIIGGLVLYAVNVQAKARLEVTSPASAAELIAPVSVSFGMTTALKLFAAQGLTPLKYEWDYNNDGINDQETFDPVSTYLVTRAGIFSVVATVTMTNGEVKTATYRLVVPRASFGVQPSIPLIEEPVTFTLEHLFTDASPKLQKAKWDFDADGTTDLETDKLTATNTYHKLGPVNVTVSMTLANQSQSSLQRTIQIVEPPEQPFPITLETEPHMLLGPPPFGVLFTLKTKEPIANATWDFGNNKSAEGLRVAQVFSTVGTFTVNVSARSQSGAIARLSKVVRVTNPLNIADLRFEGTPVVKNFAVEGEAPLTVDITPVTFQPLVSFSWDPGNSVESEMIDKTFHAVYRDEGKYFADLIGMDPDQNVFRKRISVTVVPAKSFVSFTLDPATPTAPATVTFDASDTFIPSGEDITGFEWDFGDTDDKGDNTPTGARVEHRYEKPGSYTITLTVRTNAGKAYTGKQSLVVRVPLVDACFIPSRSSGKAPLGVRFDASCSTGQFESWLWDFGDASQSDQQSPTHVFLQPGDYLVTLTATVKGGLKSTKSATISVSQ